ncbi:MAG: hypothetical protein DRR42_26110 [Gammaproteobacteria bacterium]|nr:MAG: hypothetical protein DRR42_26110 [Gammaproteobacteria bacterium]
MTKQIAVKATFVEELVQETRLAANAQTAVVRGWQSVTPAVLEAASKHDVARTEALTAQLLARFE